MVTEKEAVDFLENRTKFGIKLGLESISALLSESNNPHLSYPTVHLAGTNGKGSTSSFISAILQMHGLKVGLYTSPHLIYLNERIRINGKSIPNNDFLFHLSRYIIKAEELKSTYFDVLTAVAFDYFADQKVDVAVVETGMGGRYDSTNVVDPIVSVITSIGMDHEKYLGDTIEKIAIEKAGIIKKGKPVFTGKIDDSAMSVIRNRAAELNSQLESFVNGSNHFLESNKYLAVKTSEYILSRLGKNADRVFMNSAVENMPELTGLRGRFDRIMIGNKTVILDAAHNPDGAESLCNSYLANFNEKPLLVFGAVADKNYDAMLFQLRKLSNKIYLTLPVLNRGNSIDNLNRSASRLEFSIQTFDSVKLATERAIAQSEFGTIVFCGSIYLLGEVYSVLFDQFIPNELHQGLTINQ